MRYRRPVGLPAFLLLLLAFSFIHPLAAQQPDYTQRLMLQLKDNSDIVRVKAARIFGTMRCKEALPQLISAMNDGNPMVRAEVAKALGKIGDPEAVDPLLKALNDDFSFVKAEAALALGKIGDPKALKPIIALQTDQESDIREQATLALGYFVSDEVYPPLIAALNDQRTEIRLAAIRALTRKPHPTAIPALITAMSDSDAKVRLAAARLLIRYHSQQTVDAFVNALQSDDPALRCQAAFALGQQREEKAFAALLAALSSPKIMNDDESKAAIARSLGAYKDERAIEQLFTVYNQRYREESRAIASALIQIGEPAFQFLLHIVTTERDFNRRGKALLLLKGFRDPRILDPLLAVNDTIGMNIILQGQRNWQDDGGLSARLNRPQPPIAIYSPVHSPRQWCHSEKLVDYYIAQHQTDPGNLFALHELTNLGNPRGFDYIISIIKADTIVAESIQMTLFQMEDARALDYLVASLQPSLDKHQTQDISTTCNAIARMWNVREIDQLLNLLQSQNKEVRKQVVATLGCIGDARAVEPIINLMKTDSVPEVREYCALSLGLIGEPNAVPALIDALKDPVEWARSAAAWALGEIGDTRALVPLEEALKKNDPRFNVRVSRALWQVRSTGGVDRFLELLQSPDSMVRSIASFGIGEIRDPRAVEAIIMILDARENVYRGLQSLINNPNPYAAGPLMDYLENAEGINEPYYRTLAAKALGVAGDKRAVVILAELALYDEDESVRVAAATAMAQLGDARGADILLNAVQNLGSNNRTDAAMGLAFIKNPKVTATLATALQDNDPLIGIAAARSLALQGDPRGVDALVASLASSQEELIQIFTMQFMGETKDRRAVLPLLEVAKTGGVEHRMAALTALGEIGDPSTLQPMLDILTQDRNPRVQLSVARALGGYKDPGALRPLCAALQKSKYARVRQAGAAGLGKLGMREGIQPLITALADEATGVRAAAASSLKTISGQDFGENQARWRAWAAQQ